MAETQTTGTVAAYFDTQRQAETAIDALEGAGFTSRQIGLAANGTALPTSDTNTDGPYRASDTKTRATGTSTGENEGFWGKVKSFFEGGEAEPYAGERSEDELGTSEITTPGAERTGYGHDDLHGSLSDLSVPDAHAMYFRNKLSGADLGYLVTVTAEDRVAEAREILERNGGDVGNDTASFAATPPTAGAQAISGEQNLKLYGEVLRVHKDRISRGEVRIRKEVTNETQTIEVPVTREELVIERVPVAGGAVAAGEEAFANREIRIPLSEEQARVEKQAVVVEEVHVGKREVSNVERFDETVRSEDLKVEDDTKVTGR